MSGDSYKHPLKWAKMPKPLGDIDMPWLKVHRGTWDACWPWLGTLNSDGYGVFKRYCQILWMSLLRQPAGWLGRRGLVRRVCRL